jgi:hypothetical protein
MSFNGWVFWVVVVVVVAGVLGVLLFRLLVWRCDTYTWTDQRIQKMAAAILDGCQRYYPRKTLASVELVVNQERRTKGDRAYGKFTKFADDSSVRQLDLCPWWLNLFTGRFLIEFGEVSIEYYDGGQCHRHTMRAETLMLYARRITPEAYAAESRTTE